MKTQMEVQPERKTTPEVVDDFLHKRNAAESHDFVYAFGQLRYKCQQTARMVVVAEWHADQIQTYEVVYRTAKFTLIQLRQKARELSIELKPVKDTRF